MDTKVKYVVRTKEELKLPLDTQRLEELRSVIKPIKRIYDEINEETRYFHYANLTDPVNTSYQWGGDGKNSRGNEVTFDHMFELDGVFPCGYYGLFKPSEEEVIANLLSSELTFDAVNGYFIRDNIQVDRSGSFQTATIVFGRTSDRRPLIERN